MTIRIFCGNCGNLAAAISDRLTADGIPHTIDSLGTIEATTDRLMIVKSIATRYQVPALIQVTTDVFVAA